MSDSKVVQKIYAKIEEIPTLSPLLQKIVGLVQSSRTDAQDLTEVISGDPSLTSKILKAANSAYYGFSREIDNLDRAVALLGFNMIRSLAMSIGLIHIFPKGKADLFSRERLWVHSLAVATAMKELSYKCGRQEDGEFFYITGLLHDIGKMVLDQFFTEDYDKALKEAGCLESVSVCEAEEKHFGMDHGEVGSILLKRWKFPEDICNLIYLDHKREVPDGVTPSDVAILHIADILSKEAGMGVSENITPSEIKSEDLESIGLKLDDIDEIRDELSRSKESIHAFFNTVS